MSRIARLGMLAATLMSEGLPAAEPQGAAATFRAAVQAVQEAAHRHPDRSEAYFTELESGFRRLQSRFPSEPEVYAELLFVADHTRGERSLKLTKDLLDWPAPALTQEKARGVLRKKSALGAAFPLTFATLDGPSLSTTQWLGRVVVVDFWATWCTPCREKLPELRDLYARLHPRGLEMVGVSFDEDPAKLRQFLATEKIPWPQVCDGRGWTDSPLAAKHGITSLPALWLIDRRGRLRDLDARDDLPARLEALLSEAP